MIMAPLGVTGPLILFRKNGRVLHQWFGVVSPDEEEHSAQPPLQLLPALLVPCVALLVLVHPLCESDGPEMARLRTGNRPYLHYSTRQHDAGV